MDEDEGNAILEHFGVKGQKWGVRRAEVKTSKKPRRKLSPSEKQLVARVAVAGASVAVRQGIRWAAKNPDKIATIFARANNFASGTKAIGPGYDVFKLSMSAAGVYR